MYKKHPDKILNESYTGWEIPLASLFMSIFLLSLFLSFFNIEFITLSVVSVIAFFATYVGFFKFILQKEKGMITKTPFILFSRTIMCFLGFGWGIFGILRGRK